VTEKGDVSIFKQQKFTYMGSCLPHKPPPLPLFSVVTITSKIGVKTTVPHVLIWRSSEVVAGWLSRRRPFAKTKKKRE